MEWLEKVEQDKKQLLNNLNPQNRRQSGTVASFTPRDYEQPQPHDHFRKIKTLMPREGLTLWESEIRDTYNILKSLENIVSVNELILK